MKLDFYAQRYPHDVESAVVEIFIATFSAPPRNESWDVASATEYIRDHYHQTAILATISNGDDILGFADGLSLDHSSIADEIRKHSTVTTGFYLSDIAIKKGQRGRGVGSTLLDAFVSEVGKRYQFCIARTRQDAHEIRHLLTSLTFAESGHYRATLAGSEAARTIYVKELESTDLKSFYFEGRLWDGSARLFTVPSATREGAERKLRVSNPNLEDAYLLKVQHHY